MILTHLYLKNRFIILTKYMGMPKHMMYLYLSIPKALGNNIKTLKQDSRHY